MTAGPIIKREERLALVLAERKADERYAASLAGMQATAAELRRGAVLMRDSNDREAMLRIAADYDQRANAILRRSISPR